MTEVEHGQRHGRRGALVAPCYVWSHFYYPLLLFLIYSIKMIYEKKRGKGAGKGKDKGKCKGKGKGDRRANQADKDNTHQACEQCGKYHQYGQSCKNQNSIKSKMEKDMAEAMIMSLDKFRKKLGKSSSQTAKTKKDDSAETKKELKKLQIQVKEMKEAQVARREKSDSDATEDSGWGSDEDANRSDLCEMVPKVRELFAAHNSDSVYTALDNGEAAEAEGCDFKRTIEEDRSSDDIVSLWDPDESDSDYNEGQKVVHVINMTQKSKKEKKKDKKKDNLRKSRQSEPDARLQKTVDRPENKSMGSTPKDESQVPNTGWMDNYFIQIVDFQSTQRQANWPSSQLPIDQ